MECKLTAHDSKWAGRDLIRIESSWVYCAWVQMLGVSTPSPPSLPVLCADWFHASVSHEAHHRCLSPLACLTHRSAVCSVTEVARKCSVVPWAQHPSARSTSALQLFLWSSSTRSVLPFFSESDTPGWWNAKISKEFWFRDKLIYSVVSILNC